MSEGPSPTAQPKKRRTTKVAKTATKTTAAPFLAPQPPSATSPSPAQPAPSTSSGEVEAGARLPMTALLFQAPEITLGPAPSRAPEAASGAAVAKPVAEPTPKSRRAKKPAEPTPPPEPKPVPPDPGEPPASPDDGANVGGRKRRRGGRGKHGKVKETESPPPPPAPSEQPPVEDDESSSLRHRKRRRSAGAAEATDEVQGLTGSTRLEAKRQRRRDGRDTGRRRPIITEAEFLARRESVDRVMVVRELGGRTQIAVLEDKVLVEHYVSRQTQTTLAGNVYLGRVQNVLPSMEAAFVDIGRGRNAVLYAGEVNWDSAGLEGQPKRIEEVLNAGDSVLVQVTKDPIGHKGARLTSQITLAGRFLVLVPNGGMTGISRKLPDSERSRLKRLLKEIVPAGLGVIVRTAAEGATEEELKADITRLTERWAAIDKKAANAHAPALLKGEPDVAIRVVRDVFNEDFGRLIISGDSAWNQISAYINEVAPDLAVRMERWTGTGDVFAAHRVDEQLAKGMDRKVWLPSGGSLVIDRTEAMTVVDVNTGKFTGTGGTLEETVTRNNLEAAEEIVRQLRLRDIGGIIVIDFIDMVLESNRDLVLRRMVECLGRDRTRHQVAEVTTLGLVQMTRKRVGQGLVEAFSEVCQTCAGRGFIVHHDAGAISSPPEPSPSDDSARKSKRAARRAKGADSSAAKPKVKVPVLAEAAPEVKVTLATIAAAAGHGHESTKPAPDDAGGLVPESSPEPAPESAPSPEPVVEAVVKPKRRSRRSASAPAGPPPESTSVDSTAAAV